jgi:hypothetical protein
MCHELNAADPCRCGSCSRSALPCVLPQCGLLLVCITELAAMAPEFPSPHRPALAHREFIFIETTVTSPHSSPTPSRRRTVGRALAVG